MERLRVGLLIDDSLDRPDGVQQYILSLGAWLASRGHEVHYICGQTTRDDLPNLHVLGRTLTVRFNGNRLGTPLPVSRSRARRLVADLGLDVLHVATPYSPLLAGRVISASQRAGVATVATFMIYPQSRLVSAGARVLGLIERRRLRRFDRVLALSEAAQEFASGSFRVGSDVLGVPVNVAAFTPREGELVETSGSTPPAILFLGRLVPRKGPRELIEALALLHAREPQRKWTAQIAGRGPMLDELAALAEERSIADRVTFPGFVAEEDKAALLGSADVIALPSTGGESFGVSVVEALAAANGVVLAGDNPGYRTVMRGLEPQLVNPSDIAAFAGAIGDALDLAETAERRDAALTAQRKAAARFDQDVIGEQILRVYSEALAAHGVG